MSQAGILNISDNILPPDVPLVFEGNTGPGATAVANVLNIIGSGGVSTNATGNTITITVNTSGFTWNEVTDISPPNPIQIVKENGYICNGSLMVTFLLPLAPSIGDSFIIISNTSRFKIIENGGQQICIGTAVSTPGSGNAISNSTGDMVEFLYLGGNVFRSFPPQGTISLN